MRVRNKGKNNGVSNRLKGFENPSTVLHRWPPDEGPPEIKPAREGLHPAFLSILAVLCFAVFYLFLKQNGH